jgi:type I restriction enzyme S subunit
VSNDLPVGWAKTNVGSLGTYINGRGFCKNEWKTSGLPIIRIQNLNTPDAPFNYSDKEHEQQYRVENGDLLVSWAASLGVYLWERGPAWLNQHIFRVEVLEQYVSKRYLFFALKHALAGLFQKTHGSGMVHITKDRLESYPLLLAPRNEQERIVSKIDQLFSNIEDGERALERAQKQVERYRQSVLKAAVTGELTREWREKNKGSLESGEALLTRILKAHRAAWEKSELAKMKAKGQKPANDAWKSRYRASHEIVTDFLNALPAGWAKIRIDVAGEVQLGRQRAPQHHAGKHMRPYLRVANVFEEFIDASDVMTMNFTPYEFLNYKLENGDILLNEGQSKELVGRPAIFNGEVPNACFTNTLVRVQVNSGVLKEYALMVFLHYMKSGLFQKIATITTNIAHLGAGRFAGMSFPLPSLQEQKEIVSQVESRMTANRLMTQELVRQRRRLISLRQSVLKSAFSGQLVLQDPNDEPASVLLEHIATERAQTQKKAVPTKGRRKKATT